MKFIGLVIGVQNTVGMLDDVPELSCESEMFAKLTRKKSRPRNLEIHRRSARARRRVDDELLRLVDLLVVDGVEHWRDRQRCNRERGQ